MFFSEGCGGESFLARAAAVRGGNLAKKKLEGGWGGGRSTCPPLHLAVLAFLSLLLTLVVVVFVVGVGVVVAVVVVVVVAVVVVVLFSGERRQP